MAATNITLSELHNLLDYDSETGFFRWKRRTSNRVSVGDIAGQDNGAGYIRINIYGRRYYGHRLAVFYTTGEWPQHEVDHADGNRANNAISNLRLATHKQNSQNQPLRSTNTSGKHGVSWSKLRGKWAAYICDNGQKVHLGLFESLDAAGNAYLLAKAKLHSFQKVPRDCEST